MNQTVWNNCRYQYKSLIIAEPLCYLNGLIIYLFILQYNLELKATREEAEGMFVVSSRIEGKPWVWPANLFDPAIL